MSRKRRNAARFTSSALESLETRTLLSVLINAKPTIEVVPDSPRVRVRDGMVAIIQPTPITIVGTAQPPASNVSIQIEVYGLDADGNVLNNDQPLTTTTTNFLGRYRATFSLPTTMRADINSIIVRERATGFLEGTVSLQPTTLTGLTGTLAIDGTILDNLQGDLSINPGTISNLHANLSLDEGTISNLQGDLSIDGSDSDFDGTIAETEGITDEIFGTLEIDIDVIGVGAGEFESDGPIEFTVFESEVTGTITNPSLSGSLSNGTADESSRTGSLSDGTGDESSRTGSLSDGTGDESSRTGSFSDGTGDESGRTGSFFDGIGDIAPTAGTFLQTGAAIIGADEGTTRLNIVEYAVSDPVVIYIHQSPRRPQPLQPLNHEDTPRPARFHPGTHRQELLQQLELRRAALAPPTRLMLRELPIGSVR